MVNKQMCFGFGRHKHGPIYRSMDISYSVVGNVSASGSGHGGCVFLATELKFRLKLLFASIGCCCIGSV